MTTQVKLITLAIKPFNSEDIKQGFKKLFINWAIILGGLVQILIGTLIVEVSWLLLTDAPPLRRGSSLQDSYS
ncbi:TPA: hypothetical protein ACYEOE_001019 [Klebsiella oxytoca]